MQYTTFYIDGIMYGVPILAVREVTLPHSITPVQGTDKRIEGLLNLRGQIVIVLNLGTCLDRVPVSRETDHRIIIFKSEMELSPEAKQNALSTSVDNIALLVESIGDVVDAEENEVEPAPAEATHEYLSGVIKLDDCLLTLLSPERLCGLNSIVESRG